ncbi:hypothetical protein AB6E30_14785 [Vibrio sp. 10N.247.311.12]|uniref:hypothetical protein n=1 Tax=Vibrio sp. 10N.247.311.12 TaxID=3229991 RepID=UPI0035505C2F
MGRMFILLFLMSSLVTAKPFDATVERVVPSEQVTQALFQQLKDEAAFLAVSKADLRGYVKTSQSYNGTYLETLKVLLPLVADVDVVSQSVNNCTGADFKCVSLTVNVDIDRREFQSQLEMIKNDEVLRRSLEQYHREPGHPLRKRITMLSSQIESLSKRGEQSDLINSLKLQLHESKLVERDIKSMRIVTEIARHYSDFIIFTQVEGIERISSNRVKVTLRSRGSSYGNHDFDSRLAAIIDSNGYAMDMYHRVVHQGNVSSRISLGNHFDDGHQLKVRQLCIEPNSFEFHSPVLQALYESDTKLTLPLYSQSRFVRVGSFKGEPVPKETKVDSYSYCIWDKFEYQYSVELADKEIEHFAMSASRSAASRLTIGIEPEQYAQMSPKQCQAYMDINGLLDATHQKKPRRVSQGAMLPAFGNDSTRYRENVIIGCNADTGDCLDRAIQHF